MVPADDLPALRGFRQRLQAERRECAGAFRVIRADDESRRQIRAYPETATPLRPDDTVLLYTDGLVERRHEPIDHAIGCLLQAASDPGADVARYADKLVECAPSDTEDDTCLLVVRVHR